MKISLVLAVLLLCLTPPALRAQARYAADGPGGYIALGTTFSAYESDYGHTILGGGTVFLDTNLYRRVGAEFEARSLSLHAPNDLRESTFLAGPKLSSHGRTLRPFAKLLFGRGTFNFPYHDASGSYFVIAPGAGIDLRLHGSRLMVRLVDFELEDWPGFSFGALRPIGVSSGLSLRLF